MLLNLAHVNINCTDVDRSVAFYETIGFSIIHVFGDNPRSRLDPDAELGEEMSFGDATMRGAIMGTTEDPRSETKLELVEWVEPATEAAPAKGQLAAGVSRIAIRTKGLLDHVRRLKEAGVQFEQEPTEIDVVGARRFALLRDPDGVLRCLKTPLRKSLAQGNK